MAERLRVDLGCGNAKRPGYVGLDYVEGDDVDHVLDLTTDRYPFDDGTVEAVFSAHFLEHIDEPNHVFGEIGRICADGALIEFYTPYAWTNEAWLYGHVHGITEEMWTHLGLSHREAYADILGGRWLLRRFVFVIDEATLVDLDANGVQLDFALRYYQNVVREFGVEVEFRRDLDVPEVGPERVYATSRFGERRPTWSRPVPTRSVVRTSLSRLKRSLVRAPSRGADVR